MIALVIDLHHMKAVVVLLFIQSTNHNRSHGITLHNAVPLLQFRPKQLDFLFYDLEIGS